MRLFVLVVLVIAIAFSACAGGETGGEAEPCDDPVATDLVVMGDEAYDPDCIEVERGEELTVRNEGRLPHTFTVDGTDIDLDVKRGTSEDVERVDLAAGAFQVVCRYHPELSAKLIVE